MSYNVALKTPDGVHRMWSTFPSKEAFDFWYAGKAHDGTPPHRALQIVAEGVSQYTAMELARSASLFELMESWQA